MSTDRREFLGAMMAVGLAGKGAVGAPSVAQVNQSKWDVSWTGKITGAHRAVFDTPEVSAGLGLVRTLLRAPDFGPDDDFLACGGDSLVALRVSGSMREHGWRLRASDLLAAENARAVAARMVRA